jgi:hypothetical protein
MIGGDAQVRKLRVSQRKESGGSEQKADHACILQKIAVSARLEVPVS